MLRDVEEMSTSETAAALSLSEENVKVRLHRGRAMVRRDLFARVGAMAKDAFPFLGARCDRMVERVFERLRSEEHTSELQSLAYLVCRLLLEKKNRSGLTIKSSL